MIKRILVGLGGTEYTPTAVRHAIELAQQHEAQLTGVTVVDVNRLTHIGQTPIGGGAAADELREFRLQTTREKVDEAIADFEDKCNDAGIMACVIKEDGDPFELMTSRARYHDLTIFGLKSLFEFGMVDEPPHELERLVHGGVRPLLAVEKEYRPIHRVMIAYSGSIESAKTMRQFIRMNPWKDVKINIAVFDHKADKAQRMLDNAAAYCKAHGYKPELEYVPRAAKDYLLKEASEWHADLIVLGNSARSLLLKRVFGETALRVMAESDRSLFLSQ